MRTLIPIRILLVLGLLLLKLTTQAQAPAWQTAVATNAYTYITATAPDDSGNVYLVGYFFGTVHFGSTSLTAVGFEDAFVAKWSSSTSSFAWAQRMGGSFADQATAVVAKGTDVYVAGQFSRVASFGTTTLTAPNMGTGNAFVVKLRDTGSFRWAKGAGGDDLDGATAVAVSGSAVYVAGKFTSATASFGTSTLANASTPGGSDAFVAKLLDAGATADFAWAQRVGGVGNEEATALAATGPTVYVGGSFGSATASLGSSTLANAGATGTDIFVAKLTDAGTTGSFGWAQRAGGSADDALASLALSGPALYATGRFGGTASFGGTALTSAGGDDVFITKLTDNGTAAAFAWVQQGGGSADDEATAIAASGPSVFVTGYFNSPTATFGTALPNASTTTGLNDIFLTKLTDAGPSASFAWAQRAGGTRTDASWGLAIAGARVYIAGGTDGAASFGTLTLANYGGFLASLTDATLLATPAATPLAGVGLFPNPAGAGSHVVVQLPAVPGATAASLALFDAVGRVVRTYSVGLPASGQRYELPLGGLPTGIYTLRVQAGALATTRRLVVN